MAENNIFNSNENNGISFSDTFNLETDFTNGQEYVQLETNPFSNADNASNNFSTGINSQLNTRTVTPAEASSTQQQNNFNLSSTRTFLNKLAIGRYAQKRRGGVLRYPLEAMTEHTDYLQIDIEKYEPIGSNYINAPGDDNRYVTGNNFTNRAGKRSSQGLTTKPLINDGTILLPIPSNLQDTNNVQYDTSSLNGLQGVAAGAVTDVLKGSGNIGDLFAGEEKRSAFLSNLEKGAREKLEQVVSGAGSMDAASNLMNLRVAESALKIFGGNVTANQLLQRANGELINPHMELLFGGPTIRNFRFGFKFSPRNEKESEQVRLIIRAFKRNMAPKAQGGTVGSGSWFLKTPNIFKLRYRSGRKNHPFLNKFKQCFLTDMQTTYTGEGVYSTYEDGTPVSMTLDLSFKELQPIYDVDYDENPGTGAVGY
tara:strand:+ start:247 stop:1524 length:1278 start_codon:yes stop_codon:yes gene_type:complete